MKRRSKLLLIALACLVLGYPLLLVVMSYALRGIVEDQVRDRLAYILRADSVEIEEVDLSLLRGRVLVRGVHAERHSMGTATLGIDTLEVDVAAMGLVVFDRNASRVFIKGAHLELSAVGAATLRSAKSEPLLIEELVIVDSSVQLVATSFFPGMGQAKLSVSHAIARDVQLHNAMAWLYKTELLDATLRTTGDLELGLSYQGGLMAVSGSLLGSEPLTVPFVWPVEDISAPEMRQILVLGKMLMKKVGPEIARRKAAELWESVTD